MLKINCTFQEKKTDYIKGTNNGDYDWLFTKTVEANIKHTMFRTLKESKSQTE